VVIDLPAVLGGARLAIVAEPDHSPGPAGVRRWQPDTIARIKALPADAIYIIVAEPSQALAQALARST
jgi:hypothetical protein